MAGVCCRTLLPRTRSISTVRSDNRCALLRRAVPARLARHAAAEVMAHEPVRRMTNTEQSHIAMVSCTASFVPNVAQ
jgi:hypothetical protein